MTTLEDVPVRSANAVFRDEFDDWGLLFDPASSEVYGVNPVAGFIWKQIDGRHTVRQIAALVAASFEKVPETAEQDVLTYIEKLESKGYLEHRAS